MKMLDKLTQWATLIGVVGAIGGGFYAWGEFNTRISNIENSGNVNELKVDMVDRITAIEDKIESQSEVDLSSIRNDINEIKEILTKATRDIEIQSKVNEIQDQKIEQVRLKATNPLAN
jgi:hypothetical protein|tara:strand:- start:51 stop:404 length:354 start_codon:yes stop_codon:yes gene_type:complete